MKFCYVDESGTGDEPFALMIRLSQNRCGTKFGDKVTVHVLRSGPEGAL